MSKQKKKRDKKYRPKGIGLPPVIVKEIPLDQDQINILGLTPLCQVDAICRGYPMPLYFATADGACREALTISDVWHDHGTTPDGWCTNDVRDMMTRYRETIHKAFDIWWKDGVIPEASKIRMMDAMRDAVATLFAAEREDVVRALNRMRGTPNRWLWDRGVYNPWEIIMDFNDKPGTGWINNVNVCEDSYLTTAQLVQTLGISRSTIRRYIAKGLLPPAVNAGSSKLLFRVGTVRAFLRRRQERAVRNASVRSVTA